MKIQKAPFKDIRVDLVLTLFAFPFLTLFLLSARIDRANSPNAKDMSPINLLHAANQLKQKGEYEGSLNAYLGCLELSTNHNDSKTKLDALVGLTLVQWDIGNLKESESYLADAISLANKINNPRIKERCLIFYDIYKLYQEGKDFRATEQYSLAIGKFKNAIHLAKVVESPEHEVKCLRQLGSTYWQISDYHEFFILSDEALLLAQQINHKKEVGNCLNNLGLYYWKIDNYSSALTNYEQSLNITKDTANEQSEADCLNNIGLIYRELGKYDKALDFLSRALALDQKLNNTTKISIDLNNIGATYRSRGLQSGRREDYIAATRSLEDCLALANKLANKATEIRVLNNLGGVLSDLGDFINSLTYFKQGYNIAEATADKEAMSMILNNMGVVQFNLGNFQDSTVLYQKAIDLAIEIRGGQVLWEAYLEMGNAFRKQNKRKEAIASYENSIKIIESIRSSIDLEEFKASYLGTDKRIDAYQNLIELFATESISLNQDTAKKLAFDILEKAKARAFLDSLEVSELSVAKDVDMRLSNQEKEIMREVSHLYTRLLLPNLSEEDNTSRLTEIKLNEERLDELKRQIRISSPAYANLRYPEIITYDEVQRTLIEPDTTFLAFSLGKEQSFGFAIRKNELKIFRAPARKIIQQQVVEYRKAISDKDSLDFSLGRTLYRELVLPAVDKRTRRIIIVPDDILNLLPFETLLIDDLEKKWLIEDYAISYVPSLSSLRELTKRKNAARPESQKDLLAFGDPYYGTDEARPHESAPDLFQDFYLNPSVSFFRLKYSGLEVDRISSSFKDSRVRVFRRENATEENLKAEKLADYKIIHFATHGLIDDKKPARSSIILSLDKEPSEDGFLQMREIFNLKLNADLVVLSACHTGLGQFIRGEGIEGLSRAFFYAGASSVLMSLWAVNDEATWQLMERLYRHLKASETSMTALRQAKLEMIRSGVFSHPFYWAGFIINGKADNVIFRGGVKEWIIPSIFIFGGIILLAALMIFRRKHP